MKLRITSLAAASLLALGLAGCGKDSNNASDGNVRGVTATSIKIGTHTDLSGPIAAWGVGGTNGMRMRFAEQNAAGGVHGRQIELLVEDTTYQVPAAIKAANKLLNVDNIFLMVGALGTPPNNAVMPKQFKAGVPNLFPLTGAAQMYEPLHPMKFSYFVSYRDQVRAALKHFAADGKYKKVCLQVVASDYGEEAEIGYKQGLKENQLESVYIGRHKATESDFTGTIASIKASGCELLMVGPLIKDAIVLYTSARAAGFTGPIVANMVPYTPQVAAAAGGKMEGFYAMSQIHLPDFAAESAKGSWMGKWHDSYKAEFGREPNVQSQVGYIIAELTIRALEGAGKDLTTKKVLAELEKISQYQDPFGSPKVSFSATKHQGGDAINLYQVRGGKWALAAEAMPY